ncbi:squalene/phytoene synthase family protein [Brevundimonas pondensis]|uniref:Squalene/phytoene synthase family protein n=1 Tax=Brevundimonas pondensis TaxID=2774189 RepID=A0ABX7SPT4_9CAUL|nr:squalene/phytoene synthase family protein [Brevundimonas pondensis]QTC89151.1 squalene/phytoene synthase family protein [Brevundimonas pondensis]
MTASVDLDAQVRVADPDRWLSSRFVADVQARADLIALYALEAELLAIPTRVTQPMLAEMRYMWWAEQLDGVFANTPRVGHPVLEALTAAVTRHGLDRAPFDALIEAHIGRVHGEPHDLDAFYVGPMQVAVRMLVGEGHDAAVAEAGRLWALSQTGRGEEAKAQAAAANAALTALPTAAFPAVAHATLTRTDEPEPLKRLRLFWSVLRGRV